MDLASLFVSTLLLNAPAPSTQTNAATGAGPPERIVLPVIQPGCDRTGDEEIVVCGRTDRRFRIDRGTLQTLRAIEARDNNANRPRPRAVTEGCSGIGPMDACGGNIPISSMALKAVGLIVKAVRGEDLRPALRQGPTDYDIYQQAQAEAKGKE